jgi:hypothetical protein
MLRAGFVVNEHLCPITIYQFTTSNTLSQHGTLCPHRNRILQPVLNLILTMQTAQTAKPGDFYNFQAQIVAVLRTGRGVNWFTRREYIIWCLGSCARGFGTKHGTG